MYELKLWGPAQREEDAASDSASHPDILTDHVEGMARRWSCAVDYYDERTGEIAHAGLGGVVCYWRVIELAA